MSSIKYFLTRFFEDVFFLADIIQVGRLQIVQGEVFQSGLIIEKNRHIASYDNEYVMKKLG